MSAAQGLGQQQGNRSSHQDAAVQELHVLRWRPSSDSFVHLDSLDEQSYWGIEEALAVAADHQFITGAVGMLPGVIEV